MTNHGMPYYDGLDKLKELTSLIKRQYMELPHLNKLDQLTQLRKFNTEGYAVSTLRSTISIGLILKNKDGKLDFYYRSASGRRGFFRVTTFSDKERAKVLMDELFHDPLYHQVVIYEDLVKYYENRLVQFKDTNETTYLGELKRIYLKAVEIQGTIMRGQNTFGCAKRYKEKGQLLQKLLNTCSVDLNDGYWTTVKHRETYIDESYDAFALVHGPLPENYFKLHPVKPNMFGAVALDLHGSAGIEARSLHAINLMFSITGELMATDKIPNSDLLKAIDHVCWGMLYRDHFGNYLKWARFRNKVMDTSVGNAEAIYKNFVNLYCEAHGVSFRL